LTYGGLTLHQADELASRCHVETIWMVVPTTINQTFNPSINVSPGIEQFFAHAVGMTPSNFCLKFAAWSLSQNGEQHVNDK